ncbi:uncharacterized protein CTRU02_201215 [Colletotrichum truncatum]|uniref:Uncharacterized protein n=1 Tax=Colletotrichum truncatum TaxID=5467 RepID=A0ACC3ZGV8_COLTU|nr:uncharacterized protein CTRU02_08004 [Colletotrichum truncatum]KAF6790484.1 hypothetical protein CTRU02_08004 [Colletotrichum truncatum]
MFVKSISITAIAAAIFAAQAAQATAGIWDSLSCTEVSFETLFAVKNADNTVVGPKGLYATTTDNQCVYVDGSAGGAFATDHPSDHAWFISVAKASGAGGIDFLSPNLPRGLETRQASCGQICDSSLGSPRTCNSCSCRYDYTTCGTGGFCTSFYRCK